LGFLAAVLYVPPLTSVFKFATLQINEVVTALGAALLSFALLILLKRYTSAK
jgi:hypothetical protein